MEALLLFFRVGSGCLGFGNGDLVVEKKVKKYTEAIHYEDCKGYSVYVGSSVAYPVDQYTYSSCVKAFSALGPGGGYWVCGYEKGTYK